MTPSPIQAWEHRSDPALANYREWLQKQKTNQYKPETLGLHEKSDGFAPGNYIGMVWLGEGKDQKVLRVDSKFPDMDYIAMYVKCMSHPKIAEKAARCLYVWEEQNPISTNGYDFSILAVIAYLRELNELCQRHMRRHFICKTQNFVGKVKGKILINKHLQHNIARARPDRIYCEYQSESVAF